MILLNFAHPLTDAHLARVAELAGRPVERVIDAPAHFAHDRPFPAQVHELLARVGFTPAEWQTLPLLVNLPSLAVITGVLLAELHGRCGYFPTVLRSSPTSGTSPVQYEVAELLNLQAIRDVARTTR